MTASLPRFENKYLLSRSAALRVAYDLRRWTKPDRHSARKPTGRYLVRSLYYDSRDFRAYAEKSAGIFGRFKLRTRTYAPLADEAEFISVEIKAREGVLITKFTARTSPKNLNAFEASGFWDSPPNPVLTEFQRIFRLQCLQPKALVEYDRTALVARDRSSVRITFDYDIRAARARTLFPDRPAFRRLPGHLVVLEIKSSDDGPDWLQDLVRRHGLRAAPNSKYAQAVEAVRHDLFRH